VKTYHEYEPADIDLDAKDPVVTFLFTRVLIMGLTGFKPQEGDPEDPTWPMKRIVADFLNAAERAGITIAKRETVPEVFRS
jgi:hypothetical protein